MDFCFYFSLSLPSVKTLMQDPRQRGRDKLRARLLEMDDQLSAIEQISADMENDYKNTRLVRKHSKTLL